MKPRKKAEAKLREIRRRNTETSFIVPVCQETFEKRKIDDLMDRIYIAIKNNVLPSSVHITRG